jgi:hypothetical protein
MTNEPAMISDPFPAGRTDLGRYGNACKAIRTEDFLCQNVMTPNSATDYSAFSKIIWMKKEGGTATIAPT